MSRFRYGAWRGGPDPLAGPVDVQAAVDAIGRDVLEGSSVRDAVRDLLRRGLPDRQGRGLRDLQAAVERRRREVRRSGKLDGTLQKVRELLRQALEAERAALADDDSDEARLAEAELDTLPSDTARAVRELQDHQWRSPDAEAAYQEIRDLLRREVLDQQFAGLRHALQGRRGDGSEGDSGSGDRGDGASDLRDMLADLNALLAKHARGEDTADDFRAFMDKHGDLFPNNPQSVDELVDELARQAAAAERFMRSLTPEQRSELAQLMSDAMGDMGLAAELSALRENLRDLRPGLDWSSRERFTGSDPLSYGEGTEALAELADLESLAESLAQNHSGASLDDVDLEAVERQLGQGAASDVQQLRELERELRQQGWLTGTPDALTLSPKALRRLGQTALSKVFAQLHATARGGHDDRSAGSSGESTGSWRAWEFGDEQPLDAVRTVSNAVLRSARSHPRDLGAPPARGGGAAPPRISLAVEDFAVVETERRSGAAVALCVDLSWSMFAEGRWAAMKQTALALDHLITTRYPQDALQVIGFGLCAEMLSRQELATVEPAGVQGTNLQEALALARRHLARHPQAEPVVLVITDGEPTAHTDSDGEPWFHWPTTAETLQATVREVDQLTRSRVPINTFMLGDDPGLRRFVDALARRNGGRVFATDPDRLGEYVVADYLRARQPSRRAS
jgi:uncharacterized protein with von Willebrand factor type A (vWA) domain